MSFGFNSAIWQLVKQSDWVSKYIVMLSLAVLSVVCVAIIIHKFIHYRQHKIMLARLLVALRDARTLQDLVSINKQFYGSIGGSLVETTIEEAKKLLEEKKLKSAYLA
jgi:biopolymer transport protein ExbB/TolQ